MKNQIFEININQNYSNYFGWTGNASFSVEKYNGTWEKLVERWGSDLPHSEPGANKYIAAFFNDHGGSREEIGYVICDGPDNARAIAKAIAESWGCEEYVCQ